MLFRSLDEYTQEKINKINLAPAFASVQPNTTTVQTKVNEYKSALIASDDGNKAQTAVKNTKRKELEALLTQQADNCAEIANGNLDLYLTTGYEAKNTKGAPTGTLPAVTGLALFYGENDGELKARWNPMEDAANFSVQVYSNLADPEGSIVKTYIIKKIGRRKAILDGLPSGQKVLVRVRANGGAADFGAWSSAVEKRVP